MQQSRKQQRGYCEFFPKHNRCNRHDSPRIREKEHVVAPRADPCAVNKDSPRQPLACIAHSCHSHAPTGLGPTTVPYSGLEYDAPSGRPPPAGAQPRGKAALPEPESGSSPWGGSLFEYAPPARRPRPSEASGTGRDRQSRLARNLRSPLCRFHPYV